MNEINFELQRKIEYNHNNNDLEGTHIELREPTGKVSHICCEIEGLIQSGLIKMADIIDDEMIAAAKEEAKTRKPKKPKKEDEEKAVDGDAVLSMMTSSGIDMQKIVIHFRALFKEVAYVGGEKQMTTPMMDRMSHKDFRKMIGVYAANFIMD